MGIIEYVKQMKLDEAREEGRKEEREKSSRLYKVKGGLKDQRQDIKTASSK